MFLKVVNLDLSFSSAEDSDRPDFRLRLPSQMEPVGKPKTNNQNESNSLQPLTQLSDSGFMRTRKKKTCKIADYKRIKFSKLDLSKLKIPEPVAPDSQLGIFDFPLSGIIGSKNGKVRSGEEFLQTSDKTCNSHSHHSVTNHISSSLIRQERSPGKQKKINKEVVKRIRKLKNEIKFIRKRYNMECSRRNDMSKLSDFSSEKGLEIPHYLYNHMQSEM